jgi:hypothetical protein
MNSAAVILAGILALALPPAQAAGGPGGAGGGPRAGGVSGSHMSQAGRDNTNAQHLPGSTKGQERARQRMSEQGKAHSKATEQEKQQGKAKAAAKKKDKAGQN